MSALNSDYSSDDNVLYENFDDWDNVLTWNENEPFSADTFGCAYSGDYITMECLTNATIRQAVIDWCIGDWERALNRFGPIKFWNVSKVTDMSGLFLDCHLTNDIILSGWDMTNVVRVSGMFCASGMVPHRCDEELKSINRFKLMWNLKNATDVDKMFSGDILMAVEAPPNPIISELIDEATRFNRRDYSVWDTSRVPSLKLIFDCI
jgi:hypothetical protein